LSRHNILGVLVDVLERLQCVHLLDFFFFGGRRDFASAEPDLEFGLLFVVQLELVVFAVFNVVQLLFLLVCF
jgi:hypothetical protein